MRYRIKIERESEKQDANAKYPTWDDVYEQIVDGLNVEAVVADINSKPTWRPMDVIKSKFREGGI